MRYPVKTRSNPTLLCQRSHALRLEHLEVRAQPGSILGGDMGLGLADAALALDHSDVAGNTVALTRPLQRRQTDAADGVVYTAPASIDEVIVASVPVTATRSSNTSTSSNLSMGQPAAAKAARPLTSVVQPVAKVAETNSQTQAARAQAQIVSDSKTMPAPIQTPIQPTTPVETKMQLMKDYEVHTWTVTGEGSKAQMDWASFSGTAKQSTFASVAVSNDGQFVYMVGQQGNPTVGTDLIAAKISSDGASATFLTLTMSNITLGTDIAVDNNGVAYVSGATRSNGTIDPMLARINADFTGFDWVTTLINPVVSGDTFNGLALDSEGKELWVGGVWNSSASGGHAADVVVGKFSSLDNPSGPQQDALSLLVFTHPSSGNDISRSLSGDLMLAGTYSVPGTLEPALFKVDENLSNQQLAYYPLPGTSNDFSRLDVDPRGNFYATGRAALTNAATNVDLTLVKYNRDFEEQWSHQYNNPTDASKDFFSSAIVVNPRGESYVAGRDTGDVFVAKFERDGASITDSIKVGSTPVGTFTGVDGGLGIDRMVTGELYVGGRASSPNFPVTTGAFAPTYNGTPGDAFSMQVSDFA